MTCEYGGLQITGGSGNFNCKPTVGTEISTWTADIAAGQHGNLAVQGDETTGRLTLEPGVYKVDLNLTLEGNYSSGTSGDYAGVITAQLSRGGTLVAGTKSAVQTATEGLKMGVTVNAIVEITAAQKAASTNYVSAYLIGGDASGNDVTITEGRLLAQRLR